MIKRPSQFDDQLHRIISRARMAENIQDPKEKGAVLTRMHDEVQDLRRAYLDLYNEWERHEGGLFGGF
jgi:hypothetical protein